MADFGLAAQIGRGNAMPGAQQQDPQNRMLQMMQLQQLQQNMMLAREQEGRAAGLYGPQLGSAQQQLLNLRNMEDRAAGLYVPQLEGERLKNITEVGRQGLLRPQTDSATQAAASATRGGTAAQGVLDYIRTTPPEERTKPERLDALRGTNPGAYIALTDQINAANIVKEKARTEEFTSAKAKFEFERVALNGMSSLLHAVTDQDSYSTIYPDYKKVDPVGSKIIGPEYTPKNVAAMRARIQDLGDLAYGQDAFGNETATNKRTGKITLLAPATPASRFGSRVLTQPGLNPEGDAATYDAARTLGAAPPPGASPGVPYTPPGMGPKAAAAGALTTAQETAKAAVKEKALQPQIDAAIKELTAAAAPGGLISKSTGSGIGRQIDQVAGYFGTATPGAVAGGQLGPIADLALKIVPRFEGPQSDKDAQSYKDAAGSLADTSIPVEIRQAAAKEVVRLLKTRRDQFTMDGATPAPGKIINRAAPAGVVNWNDLD
jgi:hypothetical protein